MVQFPAALHGIIKEMKNAWAQKQKGFTIVELLIVIVVIGILAAITIVAYSGIQTRSENTKTINSVSAYARAIHSYATINSAYPINSYPCLGPAGTKCANIIDSTGVCNSAGGASYNAGFDTTIKTVTASLPAPSTQSMNCGGKMYSGAWYNSASGTAASMTYYLKGDVPCVAPGGMRVTVRYQADDTTACYVSFPNL